MKFVVESIVPHGADGFDVTIHIEGLPAGTPPQAVAAAFGSLSHAAADGWQWYDAFTVGPAFAALFIRGGRAQF